MASGASVHKDGKKVVIIYNDIPSVHKRLKANHLPPPPKTTILNPQLQADSSGIQ